MRLIFVQLVAMLLLAASLAPAAYSAGIDFRSQPENLGLYMQTQNPPEPCFVDLPVIGCIKNPITPEWANNTLLNVVRPGIIGLGNILDGFQSSEQNFLTQTPAFWDLPAVQAVRVVTLFIAYVVVLQIMGFWVSIKMIVVEALKKSGFTPDFVLQTATPEGTTTQFLIGCFIPAVMFQFGPWLIGINNDFCAGMNISLKDILLPPPDTDNFLVLIVMAVPYLLDDILILGALTARFFFLGITTMLSVIAATAVLKEEYKDLFQMFLALYVILVFFQVAVMMLLWIYLTFALAYGGAGMTLTHTIFMTGTAFIVWKSRSAIGAFVQRAGLHRLQFWNSGGTVSVSPV